MSETAHYKLYTSSDDTTKFKEFREKLAGDTDSNMTKIDSALKAHGDALAGKQDVIAGTAGQVVGFDASGNAVAQEAPDIGVKSFNGRTGAVTSQDGDYTAEQVGASPISHKHTKSDITDFPTSMPASDVPAWAKAENKPSYTAADVGAKASGWVPFAAGTTAPSDKTQLWIDTTANTGGLKYWNGSAWVTVPVGYT